MLALTASLAASPAFAQQADRPGQQPDHPGKPVYDRWCAGCHGVEGRGEGAAAGYMLPRPRDFTRGQYQIRMTASGELPTDADILRIIDEGMPGTSMPGWRRQLSSADRNNLVSYLKTFSRFFENAAPEVIDFGRAPRATDEVIAEGRRVYEQVECWKCHGQGGRGDGESAPTLEDDTGFPVRAADLTEPWRFNGGGSVDQIYRRLRTGLDGTPMPSFTDAMDAGIITADQLWSVAHYVRSLAPRDPVLREVVRAARIEGDLPASPDDDAWDDADRFYIPLVGQIIVKPRWFNPSVHGVWVQAVHNGEEIALRLAWSDPSRSPSPVWAEWREKVHATMEPKEGPEATAPTTVVAGDASAPADPQALDLQAPAATAPPAASSGPLPDRIVVQFPRSLPTGMERPFFLMGTTREPVYLWHWQSQPERATEMLGRGMARMDPLPGGGNAVSAQSAFSDGQWRVVMRRAIETADTTDALRFVTQQPIPMALFAWDGDNAEDGARAAISTWYFIYLEEPVSGTLYATPIVAMLLTAGLGVFAVGRAQRRERERATTGSQGGR